MGIRTIGELAQMEEKYLQSRFGKMGLVLHSFANGWDDSPVKREHTRAPIKVHRKQHNNSERLGDG